MGSKQIENKILNYDTDLDELEEFLKENFNETITGMINSLYVLFKHAKKNCDLIEDILYELDFISKTEEEDSKIKLIINSIDSLNKKIDGTYNNRSKNSLCVYRAKLNNINQKFKVKKERLCEDNISCILRKLIYEEKDLEKIKTLLKTRKHINYKNFEIIFKEVLEQYTLLRDEEEIKYYYKLIILFIESGFDKEIFKDASKYLSILNKSGKKEHIKSIEDRLNNRSISIEDLAKKYDVNINNELIYIPNSEYNPCPYKRHDFTYQNVITIDEEGNKCNDDGFYIERNPDGSYTLYIHISDTPSIIKKDSNLDLLAYKSAETIYLSDCEISLYPEIVSNDIGSLLKGKKKNVISYVFKLSPSLEIDPNSFTIKRGVVDVYKTLSYTEVDKRIKRESEDKLDEILKTLDDVATILKNDNLHKEIYRTAENKTTEKETNSLKAKKSPAAKIVQELMVLTNKHVAMYFSKRGYPYIYRVHEEPTEDIDRELMMILGIDYKTLITNPKCVKILNDIKEKYLNAKYSDKNIGHYGLGLDYYSHSTAPLRRYADALGQYIMYDILFNCNFEDKDIYNWEQIVKEVYPYLNERINNNALFASEYHYLLGKRRIRKK